jgi:hypothetical protein
VGCGGGHLASKLAVAARQTGRVTDVDRSQAQSHTHAGTPK